MYAFVIQMIWSGILAKVFYLFVVHRWKMSGSILPENVSYIFILKCHIISLFD
jgi:glycerol-3-phosphate responsive antiterminator